MTIGKYPIIYADPPWRYTQKGLQGAAEHHYPTMSIHSPCLPFRATPKMAQKNGVRVFTLPPFLWRL